MAFYANYLYCGLCPKNVIKKINLIHVLAQYPLVYIATTTCMHMDHRIGTYTHMRAHTHTHTHTYL